MMKIRLQKSCRKRKAGEISGIRSEKSVCEKAEVLFPDGIIINILSRLPAEDVIQCGVVCKRWRDLTSTHGFKESQKRSNVPMILDVIEGGRKNVLLDKWLDPEQGRLVYHRFVAKSKGRGRSWRQGLFGRFSHGGLVVFKRSMDREVIILNPTSQKNVQIKLSKDLLFESEIYGVFFNPSLEEYCTLWQLYLGGKAHFRMLNLGSKPCWREISNPWGHHAVKINEETWPVLIGEHLYWLISPLFGPKQEFMRNSRGDIMDFDIRSGKLNVMLCPVPSGVKFEGLSEINLLDIDGVLSFVLTSQYDGVVNVSIWKLKDRAQHSWEPMNHSIGVGDCGSSVVTKAIVVVGEQLVLSTDKGLYVCNLELGTSRTLLEDCFHSGVASSHVMTLASLNHCKSKIFMNKKREVQEESDLACSCHCHCH